MDKLLFTGASGFLGCNILQELSVCYEIDTIGLTEHDDYRVNIAKDVPAFLHSYDVILHAAGKAHVVPKSPNEIQSFYDVNLQGTKNLCFALEKTGIPRSFIFISTVAVYGLEEGENITEESPLKGTSPYAQSKILAEQFLKEWCKEHNVLLSIVRSSLMAGRNAPGNLGAMIKGISTGRYLSITGGRARRSLLMALDIAHLVPLLVEKGGVYNVCDSVHPSFRELEALISGQLGKRIPLSIPMSFVKVLAFIGDFLGEKAPINSMKLRAVCNSLTFSNQKAIKELGWTPMDVLSNYKIK